MPEQHARGNIVSIEAERPLDTDFIHDVKTIESTQMRMGKDVGTTKRTVSADGKTLTLDSKLTTAMNKESTSTYVYDRK